MNVEREIWKSRIGLVLAMAGNAIGLGNFLRFPVIAAQNGGGAFMIPYFISFILMGIPLMLMEWAIGRYGGIIGHGTAPGMFDAIWKNPISKYLGILGIFLPLGILSYYTYICSWVLGCSIFSLLGLIPHPEFSSTMTTEEVLLPYKNFLLNFIGANGSGHFLTPDIFALIFFLLTLGFSLYILNRGISKGIERLNLVAIPLLFIIGFILFFRVLTIKSPIEGVTISKALGFIWEPDFSGLFNPKIWLAASGQIFFTLSLGMGAILTYASYVKKDEDVTVNGISTASLNEFAEIVLGGTIAIVSAVMFFGLEGAREISKEGAFKLGLISMPAIFSQLPFGNFFGFLWFILLFFAAITSVVALSQPAIAFFEDEFEWSRGKSVKMLGVILFISTLLPIFIKGTLDEVDFWVGTFGLVFLGLFEIIIFIWIFGPENAWNEINRGADIKIPKIFYYILKFVTPAFLIAILIGWSVTDLPKILKQTSAGVIVARIFLIVFLILHLVAVKVAWIRRKKKLTI